MEKHNPDLPFNSLSLSCSRHVIVVRRTNMSCVCEPRAANGLVLKLINLCCRSGSCYQGCCWSSNNVFVSSPVGPLGVTHSLCSMSVVLEFNSCKKIPYSPFYFVADWLFLQIYLTPKERWQHSWGGWLWWKWTNSAMQKKSATFSTCGLEKLNTLSGGQ